MPQQSAEILVIDDAPEIRNFLRTSLSEFGFRLIEAARGEEGLEKAAAQKPTLVLLDLGLPDLDGIEITRRLREFTTIPIIILSARGDEKDKVLALEAGADDYVTKPFGMLELLARIKVALRHEAQRRTGRNLARFTTGNIKVNLLKRTVTLDDQPVHLTPHEYSLLLILVNNAGKLVTQKQLLREVWGPGCAKEGHYLRVYMGQLRRKLEKDPSKPRFILTEPGLGYRLMHYDPEDGGNMGFAI
jgi:two-component system KDP operon response regulator KdpE